MRRQSSAFESSFAEVERLAHRLEHGPPRRRIDRRGWRVILGGTATAGSTGALVAVTQSVDQAGPFAAALMMAMPIMCGTLGVVVLGNAILHFMRGTEPGDQPRP